MINNNNNNNNNNQDSSNNNAAEGLNDGPESCNTRDGEGEALRLKRVLI